MFCHISFSSLIFFLFAKPFSNERWVSRSLTPECFSILFLKTKDMLLCPCSMIIKFRKLNTDSIL